MGRARRQDHRPGPPQSADAQGTLELTVADNLERIVGRQSRRVTGAEVPFEFVMGRALTPLHTVLARLRVGDRLCDVCARPFAVVDRTIDDFHFLVWAGGSNSTLSHGILQVLADHGADWIDNTARQRHRRAGGGPCSMRRVTAWEASPITRIAATK